jgi:protein MAK11
MGPQKASEWKCRVVFGTYERTICGFDVQLLLNTEKPVLKPVFIVPAHLGCLKTLAIGGSILASGGNDEVIKLFDLKRKKELGSLHQHEGSITALDFYKSSHMLSGGEDGLLCIWRTRDWECLKVLKGHQGAVNCISIHTSGRVALSVGKDGSLCMWDLLKGRLAFKKKLPRVAEKISFSRGGLYFAMVCESVVFVYKTDTVQMIHEIKNDKRIHAFHWYKVGRFQWLQC